MSHQYILISISCGDSGESKSFRRWRSNIWSNHPNVESNLHSFGSKQNRWDNGAERASPDWWPRPPHACYLYVEGSWAGDHLEQVVPHHVLAGGHRGDVLVNFPWINPNTELTGRLTDLCLHSCTLWISFSGMALSGSLSWDDGGEEVHIKSKPKHVTSSRWVG